MFRSLDVASSIAASLARLGAGLSVQSTGPRPAQRLILYDFESCPFCRKAREALSILDLEAEIRPCPKGGHRFRDECIERGGKAQFPYLVDPNSGREFYESDEIVRYLHREYGTGPASNAQLGMFPVLSGSLASGLRLGRGTHAAPSIAPSTPLELWSFEASPFSRIVRERLCELELPYVLHNVGKGSAQRTEFARRSGKMQVPYLVDPNTGENLFESASIVSYLDRTYGVA
jgi:glutathione S-transferase